MPWQPEKLPHQQNFNNFSFPHATDAFDEVWWNLGQWLQRRCRLKNVAGRRMPEVGRSGELKTNLHAFLLISFQNQMGNLHNMYPFHMDESYGIF